MSKNYVFSNFLKKEGITSIESGVHCSTKWPNGMSQSYTYGNGKICIILQINLPSSMSETLNTAAYLKNRSAMKSLDSLNDAD